MLAALLSSAALEGIGSYLSVCDSGQGCGIFLKVGAPVEGTYYKDCSIWGSIFGVPLIWETTI